MRKSTVLGILFLGSVWGVSEVFLGEPLYAAHVRYASAPLNVIALVILAVAAASFQQTGSAIAMGCCAALYKLAAMSFGLAGTPVYACHLLGIFCLGLSFEVFFSLRRAKSPAGFQSAGAIGPAARAVAAAYVSYALFAFSITYLFRYQPWVDGGFAKVGRHVAVEGTLAALGGAILVPFSMYVVSRAKAARLRLLPFGSKLGAAAASAATAALWVVGIVVGV